MPRMLGDLYPATNPDNILMFMMLMNMPKQFN